ncbi:MAG: glycine cleavage system protein GcvH [Bacteroidales bacterium]|nr:glycine cleavage system protein GcvH [Bacteroidales bacterium]MDZ4205169.1 glycine cleavage system protein GcvH [Bacteroidales bacterium]
MKIPGNLKYTKDHEWISLDGNVATIGITDFAQHELGDIVFVEVETVGESLEREETFGIIEAVKTVSDMLMPVSGEVLDFNEKLLDSPDLVNKDPYDEGWIIKIAVANNSQLDDLLSADQYYQLTESK